MEISNLSERSKRVINLAEKLAKDSNHQMFMPEHIVTVIINTEKEFFKILVNKAGINFDLINKELIKLLDKLPIVTSNNGIKSLILGEDVKELFKISKSELKVFDDVFVTLEIIILSISKLKNNACSIVFNEVGLNAHRIRDAIFSIRKGRKASTEDTENGYNALSKYTHDFTKFASEGKIDPVIGRDDEIRRTIQVLSRRTKNNPILIGESGVGKTAIVEGLANRVINGDVPELLRNRRLMSLDLGALLAGTKFRGEFEERLKNLLLEVSESENNIILFIDEIHTIVGAGATEGSMDASNLLKPQLARGELHCIGATTIDEYKKHVEKDAALARRFQPIYISEPSVQDTISILRGLKEKYELHHGVQIADSSIIAAAQMSKRYIPDRFLPDKAIDLIDEASSRLRMEIDSKPEELDELDRKIMQYKIEREVLQKESDSVSKNRLDVLEKEIKSLDKKSCSLTKIWKEGKKKLNEANKIKENLDLARNELEIVSRKGDLARAGQLTYGIIPELKKELDDSKNISSDLLLSKAVNEEHIASVVSRWTGIPVDKMLGEESAKLLNMESILQKKVVGQEHAVSIISNAVRRARTGLQDPSRPIGSFLFLGPTGVGKTELTKALADFLFNDERALLRVDMTEFMEKHSISKLLGSPPGYIGHEEGGFLTEAVKRRPYQVILFDEIEKAHKDIYNILLQILDDGRLTDAKGRTVNFSNTIIVMTSNLGANIYSNQLDSVQNSEVKQEVLEIVKNFFKPEFINRLDEIILFNHLDFSKMNEILSIQINKLKKLLSEKNINLDLDKSAMDWLSKKGFDYAYGARPLRRVIQQNVQNKLASLVLEGVVKESDTVNITAGSSGLKLKVTK